VTAPNAQPWSPRPVTWRIDGEQHTATYNPGELTIMAIARERGATSQDLEAVHVLKAVFAAEFPDTPTFIFDAEARA
jgi:hypothetical protein